MDKAENSTLSAHARELRNHMTKEERHLWYDCFKKLPAVFHRQKIIGNYIVDFYCPCAKLVVELDGSQHATPEGMAADARRDAFLRGRGLTVKRYTNTDVQLRFAAVCEDICEYIRNTGGTSSGAARHLFHLAQSSHCSLPFALLCFASLLHAALFPPQAGAAFRSHRRRFGCEALEGEGSGI